MAGCECEIEVRNKVQSKILIILLSINAVMFVIEIVLDVYSESTALIADSLDMLADAVLYGIPLYAIGRSALAKIKAAHLSGIFQILLGLSVLVDVFPRALFGNDPQQCL
jgi:Co/Zn/Cd efflux system component